MSNITNLGAVVKKGQVKGDIHKAYVKMNG